MSGKPARLIRATPMSDVGTTRVRKWWLRDPRIVGNPLSLYLYLISHDEKEEITFEQARNALGLGVEAFSTARRRLEDAGFLKRVDRQLSAFAVDGEKAAGWDGRYDIHVLDPAQPGSQS